MFKCGDQVVYAGHGVCKILELEYKRIDKKKIEYYVLQPLSHPETRFYVPTQNQVAVAKMQSIVTKEEIDNLLAMVVGSAPCWIDDENQRKQRYRELITSGDRKALICMMRAAYHHKLSQMSAGRKFHLCDENFLRDAERLLNSEFGLVLNVDENGVAEYIKSRLNIE